MSTGRLFKFLFVSDPEFRELSIITAQDPLPFAAVHTIKYIFHIMAKRRKLKPEKFFVSIPQKENNDKLVKVCSFCSLVISSCSFAYLSYCEKAIKALNALIQNIFLKLGKSFSKVCLAAMKWLLWQNMGEAKR